MGRVLHYLITETQDLGLRICQNLDAASTSNIATAYLTRDGLARFEQALSGHLETGGRSCLLVGLWDFITDPRALKALLKLQQRYPRTRRRGLEVRLAAGFGFHWKLALFGSATSPVVIVGSSNLTGKGTSSEGEVNLEIRGSQSLHEELRRRFLEEFDRGQPLDDTSLSKYERDYKRFAALRRRMANLRRRGAAKYPMQRKREAVGLLRISHCRALTIDVQAEDATLQRSVEKFAQAELSERRGWRWMFNFNARELRNYPDGTSFILRDRIDRRIGVAEVLRTGTFMNEKDRKDGVVFYRWRRGGSRRFRTEALMRNFVEKRVRGLGMSRSTVGPKLMSRLLRALGVSK